MPGSDRGGLQCVARRIRDNVQCKNSAVPGSRLCPGHGGTKKVKEPTEYEAALVEVSQFVQPISPTHPNANPINGFYETWRYNEGRIIFLQAKVAELDADALVWGRTKEERINATEFSGTNTTYEAKKSVWLILLDEALDQRFRLLQLAAKLGIEKARLESAQGLKNQTVTVILSTLRRLGLEVNDDDVKTAIREAIAEATNVNMRGTLAEQIVPPEFQPKAHGFVRAEIMKKTAN